MGRTISRQELRAYGSSRDRRLRSELTRDNIVGERRLAFEVRNYGAEKVAKAHMAAAEREQAAREKEIDHRFEVAATDAWEQARGKRVFAVSDNEPVTERPGLRDRTYYTDEWVDQPDGTKKLVSFKVVEKFQEGRLVSAVREPLS